MANMPFGFGGGKESGNHDSFKNLTRRVQYGFDTGGGMGALMGFMDLPYRTRPGGNEPGGSPGGSWQTMWPGGIDPRMRGGNGVKPPQIENPPLPPYDPNDPNGDGTGNQTYAQLLQLLYPPPIGTGAQWRNTMKYGA